MSVVQRARYQESKAALSSDWGLKVATEKFGAELVQSFPRYSRGPRKGMLKGYLTWLKVEVGGWCRDLPGAPGRAGVLRPGTYDWCLTMGDPYADIRRHSIVARWDYNGGSPVVTNVQTPTEAEQLFKTYGVEARYG